MRRGPTLAAVAAFGLLVGTTPVQAIVANPPPRVCNEYPHSPVVFSGRVLSESYLPGTDDEDGFRIYRLRVTHVYKGRLAPLVTLYTPMNSGGGTLTAHRAAVVFARWIGRRLTFSGSSNSRSGAGVARLEAAIRRYQTHPPSGATIAGQVGDPGGLFPHARLLIAGATASRFTWTDRRGSFLIGVEPGRWSVRIARPGWASRTGVYSYDDAAQVRLTPSGCADVQIEVAKPGEPLPGRPSWSVWH